MKREAGGVKRAACVVLVGWGSGGQGACLSAAAGIGGWALDACLGVAVRERLVDVGQVGSWTCVSYGNGQLLGH